MARLKLTLEYDGTAYVGWQRQKNGPSVQEAFEKALSSLMDAPTEVEAAGRTDAGVHAAGQVVAFSSPRNLPARAFTRGLNGILPADISVVSAEEVEEGFDPRRWASGKRYRYLLSNRPQRSALRRNTHWELFAPVALELMQRAAPELVGRHDFSAFRAADCQARHAVREMRCVSVAASGPDEIAFEVEGTAFLKHMVRNFVGSLVEVGRGKREVGWLQATLRGGDRVRAGPTAPPQGLTLMEVSYAPGRRRARDENEHGDE